MDIKFLWFFFQGDTKGTHPTVFLCSITFQFLCFSFTFPQALAILVGRLEQGKAYTKKCFCATSITLDPCHCLLAQLPGPSTNAQLKCVEINNDVVQESASRIAKLPSTSLLVI